MITNDYLILEDTIEPEVKEDCITKTRWLWLQLRVLTQRIKPWGSFEDDDVVNSLIVVQGRFCYGEHLACRVKYFIFGKNKNKKKQASSCQDPGLCPG